MPKTTSKKAKTAAATAGDGWARRVERYALAALLLVVPLAFATGFSRYEELKLALLTALGGIALIAFAIDFCSGRRSRLIGGGWAAGAAWLFVLYALTSRLWAPATPESALGLATWLLVLGVFTLTAARTGGADWVLLPIIGAGTVVAGLVVAQRFGLAFPPPIPTGMAWDVGAHGTFDHAAHAGSFLCLTLPIALARGATRSERWRLPALGAAIVMALAIGISGPLFVAVTVCVVALGLLLSIRQWSGRPDSLRLWAAAALAGAAVVVGGFVVKPAPNTPEPTGIETLVVNLYDQYRLGGPENVVGSYAEWQFEWDRANNLARQDPALGHGVGSWAYLAGTNIDPESSYYQTVEREHFSHATPTGMLTGLRVELGWLGLGLMALFLGLVVATSVRGLKDPQEESAGAAGFLIAGALAAIALALLTPTVYHAGEGVAWAVALGLAVRLGRPLPGASLSAPRQVPAPASGFARVERWTLVGGPLIVLVVLAGLRVGQDTATDFLRQRGELYLSARLNEDAIEALQAAVDINDDDYRAHFMLGLAQYYTPSDDGRLAAARQHLARAAELQPNDGRVRLQALRNEMQSGGSDVVVRLQAARRVRNVLLQLIENDPRNEEIYRQLADTHKVLNDDDEAAAVLIELLTLLDDDDELAATHLEIGKIFQDELNRLERALEHYEMAAGYMSPQSPLAHDLAERLGSVRRSLEGGSDTDGEPGGGHEGHRHGPGPDLEAPAPGNDAPDPVAPPSEAAPPE